MTAGRVGRPHGYDGSFWVEGARHELSLGTLLRVGGRERRVERRGGTSERPLLRLSGLTDPRPLRGELLLVEARLEDDEWLAGELVGCRVEGLGEVVRVLEAPTCELLELDDGSLVPFVSDAIESVDTGARSIRADRGFLGET